MVTNIRLECQNKITKIILIWTLKAHALIKLITAKHDQFQQQIK